MHDYFDILGVPPGAGAQQVRDARRRRIGGSHPDVRGGEPASPAPVAPPPDLAVDFVELSAIVERMRAAFFVDGA